MEECDGVHLAEEERRIPFLLVITLERRENGFAARFFMLYYLVQNQTRVSRYVHHSKCSNNAAPTSTFDIPYSTMKLSCIVFIHTLNIYITKPPPTLPLLLPPPLPDRHSNTIRSNILMTVYAPPTAAQTPVKNCVHPRRTSSNSTCKALTS